MLFTVMGKSVTFKGKNRQLFSSPAYLLSFMDIYFRLYKNSIRELNNLDSYSM